MQNVEPQIAGLSAPLVSPIEAEEHEQILNTLRDPRVHDFGEVAVTAGKTPAGKMVVLLALMSGVHAVISYA